MACAGLDQRNRQGDATLHVLAGQGCCEGIRLLLEHGADANSRGARGRRPLHAACDDCGDGEARDDLDAAFETCVAELVASGADVDAEDDDGATALLLASAGGKLGCVIALLRAGALVDCGDALGNTPLHAAAAGRHVACLGELLRALGAAPPTSRRAADHERGPADGAAGPRVVVAAPGGEAHHGRDRRPRHGADGDGAAPPPAGDMATSAAVAIYEKLRRGTNEKRSPRTGARGSSLQLGSPQRMQLDVTVTPADDEAYDADEPFDDARGDARQGGSPEAPRVAAAGAWVECFTETGDRYFYNEVTDESAWDLPAASLSASPDVTATPRSPDASHAALLQAAAVQLDCAALSALLESGAAPDAIVDADRGSTALHVVARAAHHKRHGEHRRAADAVIVLCDFGAAVDALDSRGDTALHVAAGAGAADAVEALLDAGTDAAKRGDGGDTPLHAAIWHRRRDVVELLLRYGAPRDAANDKGRTPRDHARARLERDQRRAFSPRAGSESPRNANDPVAAAWIHSLLCRDDPSAKHAHAPPRSPPRVGGGDFSPPRHGADSGEADHGEDRTPSPSSTRLAPIAEHGAAVGRRASLGSPPRLSGGGASTGSLGASSASPILDEDLFDDDEALDDDLFFDALLSSPTAWCAHEVAQGFRDPPASPAPAPRGDAGCSGSRNPLYISSPTAGSPLCGSSGSSAASTPQTRTPLESPTDSVKTSWSQLNADVLGDIDRYISTHKPKAGDHAHDHPSAASSPVSAGLAAADLIVGIERARFAQLSPGRARTPLSPAPHAASSPPASAGPSPSGAARR
ncbi:ankyrin repeat-containing domain protein [Pelagophyceae sp. CCMP2097]|nr:ankyrin repeat-containing domain protein [Pelagophyceae sp. CCMP2097]